MMQLLIGLIASGKSTYTRKQAKQGSLVICDDMVVNLVHGNEYTLYDTELKPLYKTIENLVVGMAGTLKRDIVVDSGRNVNANTRKRWICLARSFDMHCRAIVFPRDNVEVHALRRFKNDHRGHSYDYWLEVVKKHNSMYTSPSLEEGIDEIIPITWEEIDRE
jgi:predicted kinase